MYMRAQNLVAILGAIDGRRQVNVHERVRGVPSLVSLGALFHGTMGAVDEARMVPVETVAN